MFTIIILCCCCFLSDARPSVFVVRVSIITEVSRKLAVSSKQGGQSYVHANEEVQCIVCDIKYSIVEIVCVIVTEDRRLGVS